MKKGAEGGTILKRRGEDIEKSPDGTLEKKKSGLEGGMSQTA